VSTRRSKYVKLDDRTGRLERAVALVNDGQDPSLMVRRGEADKYNPQTRKLRVPLDRIAIMGQGWAAEGFYGPTNILVGYDSGANAGSNWARPGIPAISYGYGGGYITINEVYGFGKYGFGQYGFGGAIPEMDVAI